MSAPQEPRGIGGRARAARGRGTAPRDSRVQAGAKAPAHTPATLELAPKAKPPPNSRKSSLPTAHQPRSRSSTHVSRASMSPPPEGLGRVSGKGNAALPLQKRMGEVYHKVRAARFRILTRQGI